MKKYYIKAVTQLLLQGSDIDAVLKNLASVLKTRGYESIHAAILEGVLRELQLQLSAGAPSVVVAKENDVDTLKHSIERTLQNLGTNLEDARVTVDPTLIGGYIGSYKGNQINKSYKEKLVTLYRSITK